MQIQYAVLAAVAGWGGLEPDLLDEVIRWQTDNFLRYGLCAAVAIFRSCADRVGVAVPAFASRLAERTSVEL